MLHVQVAFNHPEQGTIDRFIVAEDLLDLARQLRLTSNIQLTTDEDTVYASLEDDLLTDIGYIVTPQTHLEV